CRGTRPASAARRRSSSSRSRGSSPSWTSSRRVSTGREHATRPAPSAWYGGGTEPMRKRTARSAARAAKPAALGRGAPDRRSEVIGLACAALCALGGAFVPAIAKITADALPPPVVAALTSAFAAAAAVTVLAARGELRELFDRRRIPALALLGLLGTAVTFWLFYAGARRASAIETALCLQVEPVYALLGAWMVLGHRPTAARAGAIGAIVAGVALAIGAQGLRASTGVWLLLATPLCWQASHLFVARALPDAAPPLLTAARYFFGAAFLAPAALLAGDGPPPMATVAPILGVLALQGVVLSYAGTLAWYAALVRLDLARTP